MNKKTVLQFDLTGELIAKWDRIIDAAKSANLTPSTIIQCCRGKSTHKNPGGFIWLYPEDSLTISERVTNLPKYNVENLPNEEWRDVVGYEGLYQVSNCGRIKTIFSYKKGRIKGDKLLRPSIDKNGYARYCLNKNGKGTTTKLHRAVAQAFIPNPLNKPLVDHIDGNPSNNHVTNLRWATYLENKYNPATRNRHLRKVAQYTLDGEYIRDWASAQEAALFLM